MIEDLKNKIIQGDCLEIMKDIPDKSIDLVLTDPPYGIDFQSNRRNKKYDKIKNDNSLEWLNPVFSEIYRILKDDSLCFSFYSWKEVDKFVSTWKNIGFTLKAEIIFNKNNIGLGWFSRGKSECSELEWNW